MSGSGRALSPIGQKFGNKAGLALIIFGTAIIALAIVRFFKTAKSIDSDDVHPGTGAKLDIALALLLVLLGAAMFLYLSRAFVTL